MVFKYRDTLTFLKAWILSRPKRGRGVKTQMAEALDCQPSFISQVLAGTSYLSLEQGVPLSRFLKLTEQERHYFLLLIQKDRCGTRALSRIFEKQLDDLRRVWSVEQIKKSFKERISKEDEIIHFSSWFHVAVSLCVFLPACKDAKSIAEALGIPLQKAKEVVQFHLDRGILIEKNGELQPGPQRFFLSKNSPIRKKFWETWRIQGLKAMDDQEKTNYQSSLVFSLRDEDVTFANTVLREALQRISERVEKVPMGSAQRLQAFSVDSFKITK